MGRPTLYSQELADEICELITNGMSQKRISRMEGMPSPSTISNWQKENPSFLHQYTLAREIRADFHVDTLDEYCEQLLNGQIMPDVARVLIDTVKWQAGKENFKRYGDKQAIEQHNTHTHNVVVTELSTEQLLQQLHRVAQLPSNVVDAEYKDVTPTDNQ